jgi:hypothetical protein
VRRVGDDGDGHGPQPTALPSRRLGELVGAGLLQQAFAEDCLVRAAEDCGLRREDGLRSIQATNASGLRRGIANPAQVRA